MDFMATFTARVLYNDSLISPTEVTSRRASETSTTEMNAAVEGDELFNARWAFIARMYADEVYQRDDYLLDVGTFTIEAADPFEVMSEVFRKLNIDHPAGWSHRSMCVADAAVIDGNVYFISETGYQIVPVEELNDANIAVA